MSSRAHSVGSSSSGNSFSLREIEFEEKKKVYMAVEKILDERNRENLEWLFKKIHNYENLLIVFLHVHQPAKFIEAGICKMPEKNVEKKKLIAYRKFEKENMNKCLKEYVKTCASNNFNATFLSKDNDDTAKGLLELIKEYRVTELVMGAGSAKNFSLRPNKERKLTSSIAKTLTEQAEPSCQIHFISRGKLIYTREALQNAPEARILNRSNSGSSFDQSIPSRSQSMPPYGPHQREPTTDPSGLEQSKSVNAVGGAYFPARFLHPGFNGGFQFQHAGSSSSSSHQNLALEIDSDSIPTTFSNSPSTIQDDMEVFFTTTEKAMAEAETMKQDVFEVSSQCSRTESDLVQDNGYNELRSTELLASIVSQNAQLFQKLNELETKLEEKSALMEKLTQERDVALREAQQLKRYGSGSLLVNFTEFTYPEIKEAIKNFDPSHKIGEGGFGVVYKGFLRHARVAIKILNRASFQGDRQFFQELETLSQIRHPHLVTLLGACLQPRALVYEYLPLGSLDNHLSYKNRNRSLPWQVLVRIACEICSALIFLHSSHVVHGDLKPENVLLDSNFTAKLSDMGISRKVHVTNTTITPHHFTDHPKGTLPYMDPEYLGSGQLTPQYDVFSFGIVLLQLVTGKAAMGLKNTVKEKQKIEKMVDKSAGWPLEQARDMIMIGMQCSDPSRQCRPDLGTYVWGKLESIANAASASKRRWSTRPSS